MFVIVNIIEDENIQGFSSRADAEDAIALMPEPLQWGVADTNNLSYWLDKITSIKAKDSSTEVDWDKEY